MKKWAYYNENDPKACAWLKQLISDKLIMDGEIDERPIQAVDPIDTQRFIRAHWFAGIAGWDLALRLAGWPEDRPVWTGSCPCQPLSCAGKGKGDADERHLWPAFYRLIAECHPATVFGEQVASKIGREWLAGVRADLEGMGYAVGGADLCSASVGAPNIRQRLYWLAQSGCQIGPISGSGEDHASHGSRPSNLARGSGDIKRVAESESVRFNEQPKSGNCPSEDTEKSKYEQPNNGFERDMPNSRLAEPIGARLEGHAGNGDQRHESRRNGETATRPVAETGDAGGVGNAESDGRIERGTESGRPERTSENGRVDNATQHGCEAGSQLHAGDGRERLIEGCNAGGVENTRCNGGRTRTEKPEREESNSHHQQSDFWSDSIWHLCRDGKYRRIPVEPAFFPLAPRVPGRVAALRGYGNAINPQIAAEFVRAYLDLDATPKITEKQV